MGEMMILKLTNKRPADFRQLPTWHQWLATFSYATNAAEWNGYPARSIRVKTISAYIDGVELEIEQKGPYLIDSAKDFTNLTI